MESDNETFDEVLRCMQNDIVHFIGKPVKHSRDLLQEYHDRFKAVHKREVEELRECLMEAVKWSCGNPDEDCEDCVAHGGDTPCKCEKCHKALDGEKAAILQDGKAESDKNGRTKK